MANQSQFIDRIDQEAMKRQGHRVALPEAAGQPAGVHVFDDDSVFAINAALATRRPLLVRGEPGTGKSQLARAAAVLLRRAFLPHVVDARTETRDLLWSVDAVARLAEAQVLGALREATHAEARARIAIENFLHPGVLWWALDWTTALEQAHRVGCSPPEVPGDWRPEAGLVVLIDEIDKADPTVPNGLLDPLGHWRFDAPGRAPVTLAKAVPPPLVIITTNEERALPDAFVRRCLVLQLALPKDEAGLQRWLMERGRAHFKDCDEEVLEQAAALVIKDRAEVQQRELVPPGCAEYIDLLRAVTELGQDRAEQLRVLTQVAKFALQKHPRERAL